LAPVGVKIEKYPNLSLNATVTNALIVASKFKSLRFNKKTSCKIDLGMWPQYWVVLGISMYSM